MARLTKQGIPTVALLGLLFSWSHFANAQQTTSTDCTVLDNTAHYTSSTTDTAAQQREMFRQGQQFGEALAMAIQARKFNKDVKTYCASHPGEDWHYYSNADGHVISSGHCLSPQEEANAAAGAFMTHHKEFKTETMNFNAMWAYVQANNLDPRQEKSYERAYKELKKKGQLELYAK
jgi:hypothetical protein